MRKRALTVLLARLLATALIAGEKAKTWTCSLTGKTVEKCCCVVLRHGFPPHEYNIYIVLPQCR